MLANQFPRAVAPRLQGAPPFQFMTSTDNGASWSAVEFPKLQGPVGKFTPQPINSVVRDGNGVIYLPVDGAGGASVLFASKDDGKSWMDTGGRTAGRHTTLVLGKNGSLIGFGGKNTNIEGRSNAGPPQHFLQAMQVLTPEGLSVYTQRVGTNRANPYFKPGLFANLATGPLPVLSTSNCSNPTPSVSGPATEGISQSVIEELIKFKVANAPEAPNQVAAPPCLQQEPFSFNGQTSQFPHVVYGGK